jgi:hypothetical protein
MISNWYAVRFMVFSFGGSCSSNLEFNSRCFTKREGKMARTKHRGEGLLDVRRKPHSSFVFRAFATFGVFQQDRSHRWYYSTSLGPNELAVVGKSISTSSGGPQPVTLEPRVSFQRVYWRMFQPSTQNIQIEKHYIALSELSFNYELFAICTVGVKSADEPGE